MTWHTGLVTVLHSVPPGPESFRGIQTAPPRPCMARWLSRTSTEMASLRDHLRVPGHRCRVDGHWCVSCGKEKET